MLPAAFRWVEHVKQAITIDVIADFITSLSQGYCLWILT